jgi:putative ABC transport system ATP-binding protein
VPVLLNVNNLRKVFRRGEEEIIAIKDVTLSINTGEFIAITGPSGSGKSTLLYILGMLDRPTSGTFLLDGVATEGLSDDERARLRNKFMGFVFQSFYLLPRASALRNVIMPLVYASSYGTPLSEEEQRQRAEDALVRVGLKERMQHVPNELSGGQRQRVAIARAIVNNPRLLFADEPTGNLDSKSGQEILALFETLHSSGVTVLMVTHDHAIATHAHRQIQLVDGAIVNDAAVRGERAT